GRAAPRDWIPPLSLLAHLAQRTEPGPSDEPAVGILAPTLFIGRRVWPYPKSLVRAGSSSTDRAAARRLLAQSLFVDARDDGARLWAADLAVRCRAIAAVVVDASGFPMAATRRLSLAAAATGSLALLARPVEEIVV